VAGGSGADEASSGVLASAFDLALCDRRVMFDMSHVGLALVGCGGLCCIVLDFSVNRWRKEGGERRIYGRGSACVDLKREPCGLSIQGRSGKYQGGSIAALYKEPVHCRRTKPVWLVVL